MFKACGFAAVGLLALWAAGGASAASPTPEDRLKELGLTRVGTRFVVASDAGVVEHYQSRVRPLVQYMAQAYEAHAAVLATVQALEEAEDTRVYLVGRIGDIDAAIPTMPQRNAYERQEVQAARRERDQTARNLHVVQNQIAALHRRQLPQWKKDQIEKEFQNKRADFLRGASEFRAAVDKTVAELDAKKSDPAVKNALNAYTQKTKAKLFISPSKDMEAAVQAVKRAESTYSPETAQSRVSKKGKRKTATKKATSGSTAAKKRPAAGPDEGEPTASAPRR